MSYQDLTRIEVGYSANVTISADVAGTGMTGLAVRDPATWAMVPLTRHQVADIVTALLAQTPDAAPLVADRLDEILSAGAELVELRRRIDAKVVAAA